MPRVPPDQTSNMETNPDTALLDPLHGCSFIVPTSNKFNPLQEVMEEDIVFPSQTTSNKSKIPNIYIYRSIKRLIMKTPFPPSFRSLQSSFVCKCYSMPDHASVVIFLWSSKIDFHTFNDQNDKPTKIILKYLPIDISSD